jgi:hypothetical protein
LNFVKAVSPTRIREVHCQSLERKTIPCLAARLDFWKRGQYVTIDWGQGYRIRGEFGVARHGSLLGQLGQRFGTKSVLLSPVL